MQKNHVQYIASTITMLPGFTFGALLAYSAMAVPQVQIAIMKSINHHKDHHHHRHHRHHRHHHPVDDGGEQHRHCDRLVPGREDLNIT